MNLCLERSEMMIKQCVNIEMGMMILKAQILILSLEEFLECYNDKESYKSYLISMLCLMDKELGFFFLTDEILEKSLTINNQLRFSFNDKELNELSNYLIYNLNVLLYSKEEYKQEIVERYVDEQLEIHEYNFERFDEGIFRNLLSYDLISWDLLTEGEYEHLYHNPFFLTSTVAFLKKIPEFYQNNPSLLYTTKEIIEKSLVTPQNLDSPKQYQKLAKSALTKIDHYLKRP